MPMTSLRRRLKRLEGNYQSVNQRAGDQARNRESSLMCLALRHLSDDELYIIHAIAGSLHEGSFQPGALTAQQWDALTACDAAFDEECRKAGFTSAAEFNRRRNSGTRAVRQKT